MPCYEYKCHSCTYESLEVHSMFKPVLTHCPKCGAESYVKQISLPHTDIREFHTPIRMYSVAVQKPEEIANLKQRCPDADICDDPRSEDYGVPIARTRKAKLQVLKASGFVERN